MKSHLFVLPLALALAACTSGEPATDSAANSPVPAATPEVVAVAANEATLARYHWQLAEATDADGARIDALFVRDDKPVQLDFVDNRLSVRNACNLMNGGYQLVDGQLQVEPMAQTQMACTDPKVAALDPAVSTRLEGNAGIEVTGDEASPRLLLTTESGDRLAFDGKPTADTRFGSAGEQVFMEVAARTAPCRHPLIPDKQCLQVRERHYDDNGLVVGEPGEWQPLYDDIEGYHHEDGVRNVLRLKRYTVKNPPADGSSVAYVLDMVVESEQVKP